MLDSYEKNVYTKSGEDGILNEILKRVALAENGFYVELGSDKGIYSATRYLREWKQWTGLLFDHKHHNNKILL